MQQTGTLKKRRRRNLAKVNGLGTVPYDENEDNFTGQDLFQSSKRGNSSRDAFSIHNGQDTRLRFSSHAFLEYRRESSSTLSSRTRVTRDPNYHDEEYDDDPYFDYQAYNMESEENNVGLGPLDTRRFVDSSIKHRQHFLDKYSMQRLRQLLWLGANSGAFPWRWNKKENRIDKWSPFFQMLWKVQWCVVTIQTLFLLIFQLHTFSAVVKGATGSFRVVFQSSIGVLWYTWVVAFNANMYFHKEGMMQYINTLMEFNKMYVNKYLIHLDGYQDGGRVVINLAILTNISQVFVSVSQFILMPNRPWYLFSFIYPKPWYWQIPGAIQEFVVCGQVITSYMFITWIAVVHTNTLQFWLTESHNHNDSDYTSDELRNPRTSMETYKTLHILNRAFNDCVAPMGIPLVKFHIVSSLIPCGYILIRSMNHLFVDEFPGSLFYPVGVLNTASAGFAILSMAAGVFDLGCSFIDSWSRTKSKDFRRILMSCPTIKVWVGRCYFLTVTTTITFFKVIFDYIIDCIIAFP